MKIFTFEQKRSYGGNRVTISKKAISLPQIESFQFVELDDTLDEPDHTNTSGYVVCIVIDGWMQTEVDGQLYDLDKHQGILFEPGEKHKICTGQGLMLSCSSKDYDTSLETTWENNQ